MVETNLEVHKDTAAVQLMKKKNKKANSFMMSIYEASHVKPLLERLITSESNWKETLGKDWCLKRVSCNIEDEELINILQPTGKLVNRYPDSNLLAHKDVFSQMMSFA